MLDAQSTIVPKHRRRNIAHNHNYRKMAKVIYRHLQARQNYKCWNAPQTRVGAAEYKKFLINSID